ncbi:uncharacterized protein LOC111184064 [Delphinapterus leucas]|uniref:Uncharacterized protein LOC111184064 n=1 Tax=Delphinapterus leucas TaxID=9749 RepID=A0A7F8KJ71_DELLE|nr:uncharacterized protein LOC111184064 [Delphinapterus leucas]
MAPEAPRASPQGGLHGGPIEPWASQRVPPSWLWAHWQRQGRTRRWAPAVSLSETRKVLSVRNSFLARCRALPPWPRHAEPGSRRPIPHFPKSPKEFPQVRSNSDKSVSLNGGSAAREGAEGPDQRGRRDALGEAGPTGSGNGSFLGSLEVSVGASRVTLRERSARDPDPSRTRCSPLIRGKRASCSRRPVGERRVHNFGVRCPAGPARNRSGARGFSARRVWAASEILPDSLVFSPPRSHRKKSGNGNPAGATNPRNEARTKWIDGVNSCTYNRPGLHPEVGKKQQEQRLSSRKCTRSSLWQEHSVRL